MDPVTGNTSPSQNPVPPQQQAIDDFVDLTARKLDSDGLFQWVDSGEVVDVNNALVALGNEFGSEAADAALDRLQEEGLLETFVSELYGAGRGGTVSEDNRATIFANIAKYGDAETLADFTAQLESSTDGFASYGRVQEFADAIATHSSPQTKVEYIDALADSTISGRSASNDSIRMPGSYAGDTEAAAVARVLGSLEGSYAREALNILSPEQLNAVVDASIEQQDWRSGGVDSHFFDASVFTDVADTVAQYGTVEQRAQVFDRAGNRVDSIADAGDGVYAIARGETEAAAVVTEGLTRLLTSDTNAVIEELAYDRRFDDGRALTNYVEQLLENDGEATVASIQAQLLLGNDGQGSHVARFNAVDENDVATHAGKIGYFAGSVQNSVDNIEATQAAKRALVQDILGTTSGILSGTVGLAYPGAGFAIGIGGEAAKRVVDQALSEPRSTVDDVIIDASIPFDPETNNVDRSSIAFSEFQDMIDQVENANRRNGN